VSAQYTPPSIKGEHVVLTGPITGDVVLPDGTRVDVTAPVIAVDSEEKAAEVAHAIGQHWAKPENVHPGQVNRKEDGSVEILDFEYDDTGYREAKKRLKGKGR
jgi:hypothetical protein